MEPGPGAGQGGGREPLGQQERGLELGQPGQGPGPQYGWGEAVSLQPSFAGLETHSGQDDKILLQL